MPESRKRRSLLHADDNTPHAKLLVQRFSDRLLGQLGTLAMFEGNLSDAQTRHRNALALFQRLREPTMEAVAWHQLGIVFEEARNWDEAERHYREAVRLKEANGDLAAAAQTWNQLANVSILAGRPDAAEAWYRKAIEADRAVGNPKEIAPDLNNLANLLQTQPHRLTEARELAEEALAIMQTLDPGAARICSTYGILAEIADQQSRGVEAAEYRRLARDAKRNFAGTRHELRRFARLIAATVAACHDDEQAAELVAAYQEQMRAGGPDWTRCADAHDQILAGERNADVLCEGMFSIGDKAMIIETILAGLEDPSTLSDLLPPEAALEE